MEFLLKQYQFENTLVSIYEPDKTVILRQYHQQLIPFPYWSQVWPSAIALATFLLRYQYYTSGKKVLELAAGLGLPSVVAAGNATSVTASDYELAAVRAMQQTCTSNGLHNMQVQLLDWYALPPDLFADVLLLSDVSYDAVLFEIQEKIIRQFLKNGSSIIISTPHRLIAKQAMMPLLSFCKHQEEITVPDHPTEVPVTIMVLQL